MGFAASADFLASPGGQSSRARARALTPPCGRTPGTATRKWARARRRTDEADFGFDGVASETLGLWSVTRRVGKPLELGSHSPPVSESAPRGPARLAPPPLPSGGARYFVLVETVREEGPLVDCASWAVLPCSPGGDCGWPSRPPPALDQNARTGGLTTASRACSAFAGPSENSQPLSTIVRYFVLLVLTIQSRRGEGRHCATNFGEWRQGSGC